MSELARRAGLAPTTVIDVVNGKANPGTRFCSGVARALKVPADHVLRMAGHLPDSSIDSEIYSVLVDEIRYLTSEQLVGVHAFVRALREQDTSTTRKHK